MKQGSRARRQESARLEETRDHMLTQGQDIRPTEMSVCHKIKNRLDQSLRTLTATFSNPTVTILSHQLKTADKYETKLGSVLVNLLHNGESPERLPRSRRQFLALSMSILMR